MERVAIVTGGVRRLGRSLCLALASRSYRIVAFYRSSGESAAELEAELRARGQRGRAMQVDVGDRTQVAAAFTDIRNHEGRVDLLVNNVGRYDPRHLSELTPEAWDQCLAANLSGPFHCIHHALPLMGRGAQILNIGSAGLDGRAAEHALDYFVSKHGLLLMTKSMAKAYGPRGIRVNMISPGHLENSIDLPADLAEGIPLGRAASPQDVERALDFLLGHEYLTGINLEVAGGFRL